MPYIGNTIRAADDYRLIDDISSSFNGSTTSFALQVAGSAPVPFPKSPQQVLISVNGVIQEPDPTGASGFNLVGTNIVLRCDIQASPKPMTFWSKKSGMSHRS